MASQHHDGESLDAGASSAVEKHQPQAEVVGTAVISPDAVENPGHEPHHVRITDKDPGEERTASRWVVTLFVLSIVGSIFAIIAYIIFPITPGDLSSVRLNNLFIGVGIALAMLGIGLGAVHWGKALMDNREHEEKRKPTRSSDETRSRVKEIFKVADQESGFGRRKLIRNTLIGALAVSPLPAIVMFRDLAPKDDPVALLKHTMWDQGVRLVRDSPAATPIKASDVTFGSAFHVIPEGINEHEHRIEEKAKAVVLLMRLRPEDLNELPERENWSYDGIVAYSKVCTHVGCPVALFEQNTHHLLCPCHQSQFDVRNHCEVIFGPAKRPLPQLPITVDSEGYLVAQSDFHEPVGPSFWERSR